MPYKMTRRGKTTWRGQITIRGQKITKQFETKSDAKAWEAMAQAELEKMTQPEQVKPTPSVSCLEWMTQYLLYAKKYVAKTFSEKKCEGSRFLKGLEDPTAPVDLITPGIALRHLQQQFNERSGYAANRVRKNMGAAWAWGVKYMPGFPQGTPNPFLQVEPYPEERKDRYVPSESDFWKVYGVAQGQDKVLLTALYCTAARKGELFRWRWSDIDLLSRKVRLGSRKNRAGKMEYRWLPMVDALHDALTEHRQQSCYVGFVGSVPCVRGENDFVFVQAVGRHAGRPYTENRDFPQELCRVAGVKEFGCHGVRHLAATLLARQGVPLVAIQAILRHSKLSTTERYIKSLVGEDTRPHLEVLTGGKRGVLGKSLPLNLPKTNSQG